MKWFYNKYFKLLSSTSKTFCFYIYSIYSFIAFSEANFNAPASCVVFKIMDYNILSHTHMLTHIQNYKKCPRQSLNWNYRKAVLKDEFLEENPDVSKHLYYITRFISYKTNKSSKIELFEIRWFIMAFYL